MPAEVTYRFQNVLTALEELHASGTEGTSRLRTLLNSAHSAIMTLEELVRLMEDANANLQARLPPLLIDLEGLT